MVTINYTSDAEGATEKEQDRRQTVCNSCSRYDSNLDMCSACGCLVARKKFYVDNTCPEGRW